ncbi:hypothetical protein [Anaeromyxobacter sp. Fw109-5]|uniref:hypothetical protein n=1 Tax=Anaeromyxobacter sp. (strain Fw109-5) TaxID=404589 RepID=UPI0002D39AAF|nr:hypothetical protein [Anaeromyxobacter sp. Fw109-5]
MLLGGSSSRLALVVAGALAVACRRGPEAPEASAPPEERAEAPEPEATAAQRGGRTPGEQAHQEPSGRSDRHRRAAARARSVRRIEGTLERLSEERVVIRAPGEERVTLHVGTRTAITVDGRPGRLVELREGAEVRASYASGRAGRPTALSIEARSASGRGHRPGGGPPPDAVWVPNTGELGSPGGG